MMNFMVCEFYFLQIVISSMLYGKKFQKEK